jgi:transposase
LTPVGYRQRNVVERCVNRRKQWRGIATRFDKRTVNYRAAVVIVSLILWLPWPGQVNVWQGRPSRG